MLPPAGDLDQSVARTVRIHRSAENAAFGILAGTDHDSAGGISKQHGAGALGRVDAAAQNVGGNDKGGSAVQAGEPVGEHQCIDETGAGAGQVDGASAAEAEPMRDQWRARWQKVIRSGRGEQQKTDVGAVDTGICQRHVAGPRGKSRKRIFVSRPEARANSGAPFDPAWLEAETVLDLGVLNLAARRMVAKPEDARRPAHGLDPKRSPASSMAS